MNRNIANRFQQAVHHFQHGNLEHAEQLTNQVLAKQPKNSDALHLLGVINAMRGQTTDAVTLFRRALARNEENIELHVNLAKALCALGRYEEALPSYQKAIKLGGGGAPMAAVIMEQGTALQRLNRHAVALACYDRALAMKPDFAEAWTNKGTLLDDLHRHEEAISCHGQAVSVNPRLAIAWFNKGAAYRSMRRYEEALSCFDQAIAVAPDRAQFWSNRGVVLDSLRRYDDALASYDKALRLNPGYAEAWNNRGLVLNEMHRHVEALENFDKALALKPDYAKAWNNRGLALNDLRRYDDALESYDRALRLKPDDAQAWVNRGVLLHDRGRHQQALVNFAQALALDPGHAGAHYNDGICRLATGDFERGWQEYEWRWEYSLKEKNPFPHTPKWGGEGNTRSLLVWAEQGIGDQILYGSMLEELKQYSTHLMVSLDARLIALFQRSFSGIQFLPHAASLLDLTIEKQLPMGNAGMYVRKDIGSFSRQKQKYLVADPEKTKDLRMRIKKNSKLICGLSWSSKNEKIGSFKSLGLQQMMPLLSSNNLSFVDLQYGDTSLERRNLEDTSGIAIEHIDEIDNFNDIDGLAALIDACDFVVTVSNVTTHLAGALGKKTFLMVPCSHGKLWYWHEGHANALWYPSVRIFAQPDDGDWNSVIADVMKAISTMQ